MKNHLFTPIVTLGLMAVVAPNHAAAQQTPNINLDAIQVRTQQGNAGAMAAAQAYDNDILRRRRRGYTGPSLPTGVTAGTLNATNQQLQGVMNANIRRTAINQQRIYNTNDATRQAIVHGCQTILTHGQRTVICP